MSVSVLLEEESGAYESLVRSWQLTRGRWWLLIGLQAGVILVYGPTILLPLLTTYPSVPLAVLVAANLYFCVGSIFLWPVSAALYGWLRGTAQAGQADLPAIFT